MFVYLSIWLETYFKGFNVIHYLTIRCIFSALTALIMTLVFGNKLIARLDRLRLGQEVRRDGPKSHFAKQGTPTMGGLLICFATMLAILLWCNLSNGYVWICLLVFAAFAVIGGVDDYLKICRKNSHGLSARYKFLGQVMIALAAGVYLYYFSNHLNHTVQTTLYFPVLKHWTLPLGVGFIAWFVLVVVGSSNAVNLTDGLDGLAIMPCVLIAAGLAVFAYLSGNMNFSHYLQIPHMKNIGEVAVVSSAVVGSGLGFLWFNTYPAQVFMGDVGSLSLGALLAVIAMLVRQEITYFIMAGIFVLETVSVIMQVISFKLTGKRVFKMAPIHHHFELKGWAEPKVIVRFWIISVVLVLIGLATLKLR